MRIQVTHLPRDIAERIASYLTPADMPKKAKVAQVISEPVLKEA
jgi:hypothetical protein